MPCSDCVNRREFLAKSAAASAAVALTACGDGQIGAPGLPDPVGQVTIEVGDFPALAQVGVVVAIDTLRAVKRTGAQSFAAYSRVCTHEGCIVNVGTASLDCPCHGSRFDLNGQVTQGPAPRRLTELATTFDAASGTLTIG